MSVVDQVERHESPRHYAACDAPGCGVCGPLRRDRAPAVLDDADHWLVCTAVNERQDLEPAPLEKQAPLASRDAL